MDQADYDLRRRTRKAVSVFLAVLGIFAIFTIWWIAAARISIIAVRGDSMLPAIKDGDNIVLRQAEKPAVDMIVVFPKPKSWEYMGDTSVNLVKRIAAAPGDTLHFDGESFYVNDKVSYSLSSDDYECKKGIVDYTHKLSRTQIFVFGDNAKESLDSRRLFCDGKAKVSYVELKDIIDFGVIEKVF